MTADELSKYLYYVRRLDFFETPDYDYLRQLFTNVLTNGGWECDWEFDWIDRQLVSSCFHWLWSVSMSCWVKLLSSRWLSASAQCCCLSFVCSQIYCIQMLNDNWVFYSHWLKVLQWRWTSTSVWVESFLLSIHLCIQTFTVGFCHRHGQCCGVVAVDAARLSSCVWWPWPVSWPTSAARCDSGWWQEPWSSAQQGLHSTCSFSLIMCSVMLVMHWIFLKFIYLSEQKCSEVKIICELLVDVNAAVSYWMILLLLCGLRWMKHCSSRIHLRLLAMWQAWSID